jgi:site-specific recombinase XerD
LKVSGKGGKTRQVPLRPAASGLILKYLEAAGHGDDNAGALGFEIGAHALSATAATNALDHEADIANVQEWLGHANIATTRNYDRRKAY